ncbi:MAG TPA: FAD-linked oxidase C-terminal domain-containing protein, partial [Pseudoxanthomonas sp.]|nr:FAD-linked oxidase C-terminal domain-containing protein [Pseudoxanthomonas sp.]
FDEMALKQMHPEARAMLPDGGGWLFIEFGGDTLQAAKDQALALMEQIHPGAVRAAAGQEGPLRLAASDGKPSMVLFERPEDQAQILRTRESGLAATTRSPELGDTWPGWEDAAVPPARVGPYLRDFRTLLHRYGYDAALYGHFGDGCIHCRINFDIGNAAGRTKWRNFMGHAAELVTSYGGSLSGEHGDGQVRAELLPVMYGPELMDAMRQFKTVWDSHGKMNPGKVIDPYPMASQLRGKAAGMVPSVFAFTKDDHSFAQAVDRCVGVGECRRKSDGVMCPSYRATMEEQHSTRGRARLLFEMLRGDTLHEGWRDESVREALDLCLACKGCKSDCPVGVDMATLKAEFMAHHFRGRLRPRAAYSMGLIWWWSRVASVIPGVANYFLQTPAIAKWMKKIGGIAPQRDMPRYASQTFRSWFAARAQVNLGLPLVMLWPDTFNNYFYPSVLQAAVRVLEAAGYRVRIPQNALCCGRPLYAEGMLHRARQQLEDILDSLTETARQGVPVVGLEPSCVASFRDELPELCSSDARAHYLAHHTYLLTEFLQAQGYHPPRLQRRALVHTHCHQHASLDRSADKTMLERLGLDFTLLNTGCCGMAGSFGFDAHKYAV